MTGHNPTWKDIRSGMACHLLNQGWSREEIDARLGHSPRSSELNKYINYLAIDRKRAKKKHFEANIERVYDELSKVKLREKNYTAQIERLQVDITSLKHRLENKKPQENLIYEIFLTILPLLSNGGLTKTKFKTALKEKGILQQLENMA